MFRLPTPEQLAAAAKAKAAALAALSKNPPLPPDEGGPVPILPNQIPPLPDSSPVDAWKYDHQDILAFQKAQRMKSKKKTGEQWLKTEPYWKNRVGKGWKPVKVLGRGSFGVVGHWTYDGPDRAQRTLNDVAVKQAVKAGPLYSHGNGLEVEAKMLMRFAQSNTPHVIRMYRHLYEEAGGQTDNFDHGIVHRIFLEYCPGGDLYNWLGNYMNSVQPIPEYELWCVFHCLARACLVIHQGSEDLTKARWNVPEIVHFDLKLDNVLVGAPLTDTEHRDMPSFKISDFGLAEEVPTYQSNAYLDRRSFRGTLGFMLPEQITKMDHPAVADWFPNERPWVMFTNSVKNPRYGTPSNIWGIGMLMHVLMRQPHNRDPNWGGYRVNDPEKLLCYTSNMTARLQRGGKTIGTLLDVEAEKNPQRSMYSKELRALIAECLLVSPAQRVPVVDLVLKTGVELDRQRVSKRTNVGTWTPYQEPQLSHRWYSGQMNGNPANAPANQPGGFGNVFVPLNTGGMPPPPPRPGFAQLNQAVPPTTTPAQPLNPRAQVFNIVPAAGPKDPPAPPIVGPAPAPPPLNPVPSPVVGNNPGPNPAPSGPLWPIPDPLNIIVLKKTRMLGLMGGNHIIIALRGLNSNTTVDEVKNELFKRNVSTAHVMRHGMQVMLGHQKLGEFRNLQIRVTEL